MANDCNPLSKLDEAFLGASGAIPVAMSKYGQTNLREAGWTSHIMPHAVDTEVFKPSAEREALREACGIAGRFVVGICSANRDVVRKGWPEQFKAFSELLVEHPESLLMVHSTPWSSSGYNLQELADDMGLTGNIMFSEQYAQVAGTMSDAVMAEWYTILDVLSCCSYAEAFGVPIIEAQACGTPVISTRGSAMTENTHAGWHVGGSPFWNMMHRAWWTRPHVQRMFEAYEQAYKMWKRDPNMTGLRFKAREFALRFDVDRVAKSSWLPVLAQLPGPVDVQEANPE
jgi:glycosyltransferase involved in cell wall biosynthesis